MKKILVTGGGGFIGLRTCELLLKSGYEVRILDNFNAQVHSNPSRSMESARKLCEVVVGDVCDRQTLDSALNGVEGVVHLVAETGVGQSMYEICLHSNCNIMGTAVLLECIRERRDSIKSLVLASSRAVYGEGQYKCAHCNKLVSPEPRMDKNLSIGIWEPMCCDCGGKVDSVGTGEDADRKPSSIYAIGKATQEDMIHCICRSLGIRSVGLRYFNVYGSGQALDNPYTGILTTFITRLKNEKPLYVYEDGEESRDFVHVDDVAAANVLALKGEIENVSLNIGSASRLSIFELAKKLSAIVGQKDEPVITGQYRLGDVRHCVADVGLAKQKIGFQAKVSLESGLKEFTEWALLEAIVDKTDQAEIELRKNGLLGTVSDL